MKLTKKLKKMPAISQVISVILLIGLTVLAGAALFGIVIPLISNQNKIVLSTSDPTFATTSSSQIQSSVDTMSFQLSNKINSPVQIDLSHSYLYNASNGLILYHWIPLSNDTEPVISGQQGITLSYQSDAVLQGIYNLNFGQEVYMAYNASLYGQNKYNIIKSQVITVNAANSNPIFDISNNNYFNQSGSNLYFSGLPNQTITSTLSVSVWNRGNPTSPHSKTLQLFIENSTYFQVQSKYLTQTVIIPASAHVGQGGYCYVGDPCVNVSIPITRVNLTALGVNGLNATYIAFLTLSGNENWYYYNLTITAPRLISLILPNSLVAKGTGNGRVANSNLIYNGPYNANNSLDLTLTVWNAGTEPISANLYVKGLNTTAFALDSSNITSVYVPTGTMPSSLNTCNAGEPCTTVTWTITRLPLKNGNQETGVVPGAYGITVQFLEFDTGLPVVLYINGPGSDSSPYMYVNSVTWSQITNKNQVTSTVEIWDANFNTVSGALVTASIQNPAGSITSVSGKTNQNGQVTFTNTLMSGTYVLTIDNVSATGYSYQSSLNKITNNQSSYTVSSNYVYISDLTWAFTAATKSTVSSLNAQLIVSDQSGNPVTGATVTIVWSINGINQTSSVSGTTQTIKGNQGAVMFTISSPASGTYAIYVTSVIYSNYNYNPSKNNNNLSNTYSVT